MIFAQYKHAITFAFVIMGLAVAVVDPGKDDHADQPIVAQQAPAADLATDPAAAQPRAAAPAIADADWYGAGDAEDAAPPALAEAADEPADDYGVATAPPPVPTPSRPHPAPPAAAPRAPAYVPPPPPPQVPPGA